MVCNTANSGTADTNTDADAFILYRQLMQGRAVCNDLRDNHQETWNVRSLKHFESASVV